MKKTVIQIFAAVLAMLVLASCQPTGNGDVTTTTDPDTTTTAPTPEDTVNPGVDVMKFELSDYVTLGDYKTEPLVLNVYCTDEELTKQLTTYAKNQKVYLEIKDRETKEGDVLNISYAGRVEDIYFEGGTAESATVELIEENGYIDGFADDLYGIMPGTKVETTVKFPENYHSAELAGVDAVFEITVNYIMDYSPSDELIKKLTGEDDITLEKFSEEYRESIIIQNLENYESNLYSAVIDLLLEKSTVISYPDELLNYYYDDIVAYYTSYAASNGMTLETLLGYYGLSVDSLMNDAKEYTKQDLAIHAAFVAEGLTLSEADYSMRLSQMAAEYGYSSGEVMESQYGEFFMKNYIRKEMCIEHLKESLTVTTDYDEYKHLLESEKTTTSEVTE